MDLHGYKFALVLIHKDQVQPHSQALTSLAFIACSVKSGRGEPGMNLHVWQSRIEIEYYSVAYFKYITEFDAL